MSVDPMFLSNVSSRYLISGFFYDIVPDATPPLTAITCLNFDHTSMGSNGVYAVGTSVFHLTESLDGKAAYFNGHAFIEIPYFING